KLISAGVELRTSIIVVNQDKSDVERTRHFLWNLGVKSVSVGQVREFGRGERVLGRRARLSGLCGHCWGGTLCISPAGAAYPCVMARQWPVGNILESSLAEIVHGQQLQASRQTIYDSVWLPRKSQNTKRVLSADECDPYKEDRPDKAPPPD